MIRADKRKYHYIYKITRTDTGKFYIGMHSTDNIEDGYFGSGKLITRSINKHGKDKHTKEILEYLPTREALKLREKELVNEELLENKLCMNMKLGGYGGLSTKEHRDLFIAAGSKEHLRLIREDPDYRKKVSENSARTAKQSHISGKIKGVQEYFKWEGKTHSTRTKRQMSETHRERGNHLGEKNSQFGTCWIQKDGVPKKIKICDLEKFITSGYTRGRKVIKSST